MLGCFTPHSLSKSRSTTLLLVGTLCILSLIGCQKKVPATEATTPLESTEVVVTPSTPSETPADSDALVEVDTTLHSHTLSLLETKPSTLIDVDKSATFDTISVFLDGQPVKIDARPFSYETRVYLPLRQVGESLNVQIGWNSEHSTAIVETDTLRLELPVGYRKAVRIHKDSPEQAELLSIDLASIKIGTILYKDITYLPIRFTAEALGFNVKFDDRNSTVLFTSPVE